MNFNNNNNNNIPWIKSLKKEARGIDNQNLGKVKKIQGNYVTIQKGIIKKKRYYIPKDQAKSYNENNILQFNFPKSTLS